MPYPVCIYNYTTELTNIMGRKVKRLFPADLWLHFGEHYMFCVRSHSYYGIEKSPLANVYVNDKEYAESVNKKRRVANHLIYSPTPVLDFSRLLAEKIYVGDAAVIGALSQIQEQTACFCWCKRNCSCVRCNSSCMQWGMCHVDSIIDHWYRGEWRKHL